MTETGVLERPGARTRVKVQIVDTDVHPAPRTPEELRAYVPEPWRNLQWSNQVFDAVGSPIYEAPNKAQRRDSYSMAGGPPCSDPEFSEQQLFGDAGVDFAIHIPLTVRPTANPEHEAAVCAASNAWLADTWLSRYNGHGRHFGTLRVCSTDTALAVREVEKWAGDKRFVQIMMNPYTDTPAGQSRFHPIYEAACKYDMPVCMHVNRSPGMRLLTPVGFSSYFFEHHSLYSLMYASHLTSLIFEGVFEKFPTLRVTLVEGGFSWFVPLMWRLDRHWEALKGEIPNVRRRPSDYVRDHVRLSTQPMEEPPRAGDLAKLWSLMDPAQYLMFATDYPHWDYDGPNQILRFPEDARERVLCGNALAWYRLPAERDTGPWDVAPKDRTR